MIGALQKKLKTYTNRHGSGGRGYKGSLQPDKNRQVKTLKRPEYAE